MVVPADGRAVRTLSLPGWVSVALRSWVVCAMCLAGFSGWQMQARFGIHGPRAVELAAWNDRAERWSSYLKMAPAMEESERAALRRHAAMLRALSLGLGTRAAGSALWAGSVAPEWIAEANRGPRGDGTLLWPVRDGVYGRGFGSGAAGYHLAIDIEGQRGAEVSAAAPGVVGYASNELRGYGTLIMIVHPGGWVTLYAHNQRALVVPGEHVRQGQAIAELGSTGHSMGPHVHFELIHDERNCDPLPLLREVQGLPGWLPPVRSAQWQLDRARPQGVRCARRQDHPHPHHDQDDPKLAPEDEGTEPIASLSGQSRG